MSFPNWSPEFCGPALLTHALGTPDLVRVERDSATPERLPGVHWGSGEAARRGDNGGGPREMNKVQPGGLRQTTSQGTTEPGRVALRVLRGWAVPLSVAGNAGDQGGPK